MTLEKTGIPTAEQIDSVYPPSDVRKKGPYAVFECFQRIPCDPCYWSCPARAVGEFADINDLPVVDYAKCTGCGICVAACPGLAVFVIDENYDEARGLIKLPHEFVPIPRPADRVKALDRSGTHVCDGEVIRVLGTRRGETTVVWVAVQKAHLHHVRAIDVGGSET